MTYFESFKQSAAQEFKQFLDDLNEADFRPLA